MGKSPVQQSSLFKGIDLSTSMLPREVEAIRNAIGDAMKLPDQERPGKTIGSAKAGIYAFYDYDGEPIYVGQTAESFSARLGRHMTGMRSDSVAKYVLDPFEVYAIAMWSLPHITEIKAAPGKKAGPLKKTALNAYEYAIHKQLTQQSKFKAVLNEGDIPACAAGE